MKYSPVEKLDTTVELPDDPSAKVTTAGMGVIGKVIPGQSSGFVRFYSIDPASDVAANPVRDLTRALDDAVVVDSAYTSRAAASMPALMPDQAEGRTFAFQLMRVKTVPLSETFGLKAICDKLGLRRPQEMAESPLCLIGTHVNPCQNRLFVTLPDGQTVISPLENVVVVSPDMKQIFPEPKPLEQVRATAPAAAPV